MNDGNRRGGFPKGTVLIPLERRFFKRVHFTSFCWDWTGALTTAGYGHLYVGGRMVYVHRIMYEQVNGPIPKGKHIDHLCRNRACVRPEHLDVVSQRENNLRGEGWSGTNSRKTACPQGHPLTSENTYLSKRGHRRCRRCTRDRQREDYRRRKKARAA